MDNLVLRIFDEEEYHAFFRQYVPDPLMDPSPFEYNREQISRSYLYNHGGYRPDYAHYGAFIGQKAVGSLQLKKIDQQKHTCEFGIILQNDEVKNQGIGTAAIRELIIIARDQYGIKTIIGNTMRRNKRMIRVFEKLGFELIETIAEGFDLPDGKKEDKLVYHKHLKEGPK